MKMKKLLWLMMAMIMIMGTAGCTTGQDTMIAASMGEIEVPAGVYLYNLLDSYYTAANKVLDKTKDVLSQTIEEMPAAEWIEKEAQKGLDVYLATQSEFERLGLTLSETQIDNAATTVNSIWENSSAFYEKNGISRESLELVITNNEMMNSVYEKYYGIDGEKTASEEDTKAYYNENYARISHLSIEKNSYSESGEAIPLSGEALQAVKARAEGYFERLQQGEEFDTVLMSHEQEQAAADGKEYTPHNHEEGDNFPHDIIITRDQMYFQPEYLSQIFMTEEGEAGLYEDDHYYIVFLRKELNANPEDFEKRKEQLSFIVAGEGFTDDLSAVSEGLEITLNEKAIKRYRAKDLKLS